MYSYLIYTGISHVNQLTKLHPALIMKIRGELDVIAQRFGGRRVEDELYHFPPSLGETARKTAEAAEAMYLYLRENDRELFGITVLVSGSSGDGSAASSGLESLLFKVPDDNGLWVDNNFLDDFSAYLDGEAVEGLFCVSSLKEAGPRLEERLPSLLIRSDRLKVVRGALEQLERDENDRRVLLLRGRPGSGKRATLYRALRDLYPDDGGVPLVIPFAEDAEDPMEPFVRALGSFLTTVSEYLDEDECLWWENEGAGYLEQCRKGRIRDTSRDQGPVDLIQAFALYVKAYVERRRRSGRPAYILIDAFFSGSDAVTWLRSLLNEFIGKESFRLIIIRDSDDFDEVLPLPGKGHEVAFRKPADNEWISIVSEASPGNIPDENLLKQLAVSCGASLYRLFHGLLGLERGFSGETDPGESLVASLDRETRRTLFLTHAAAGLADRKLLIERLSSDEERVVEGARYDGLVDFGLIREDPDGRVRGIPGGPVNAIVKDLENIREAERFGEYLFKRLNQGDPIDLYRLFRYLEQWGPVSRGIAVLDRLFESLLTNRRLRAAGLLLNGPPMSLSDLDGPDMESLQNVIGAARLRFVLLTEGADQARSLVRDGTLSLISGRGTYSERFKLHNARYSYAVERWDEALSSSKEALFNFQKSGDHEGETHAHLELALSLLVTGRVRDALEHFSIAHRIGSQVSASWGVLRAAAMETVTQFIFGNLPRAGRESREFRDTAHRAGRRDLWLLLTLTAVRISWELGRYDEAAALAEEGRHTAGFYGLEAEKKVMNLWKGRCLSAAGNAEGRSLLLSSVDSREAHAFLAEDAYFFGDSSAARLYIRKALSTGRVSYRLQGEAEDWSDGFFPIEGRLSDAHGPLDVLGEWIEGFDAFLAGESGDTSALERLTALLEKDGRRVPGPFSYLYALWAVLITPDTDRELQTRFMSRAFNDLQIRAGRFDDNQTKHAWLSANPWNKRLMAEAQSRKFL